MIENASIRRFVREALPLLSSYFYSEQVLLEPAHVEIGSEEETEYRVFSNLLRMRHAMACGQKLKPILEEILRGFSQTSEVVRINSKGSILGKLDISHYLNTRSSNVSWPKTFPVLISRATPGTPENKMVAASIRKISERLSMKSNFDASAEQALCLNLLRWCRTQLNSDPLSSVSFSGNIPRLYREVEHRIRKRQTGNESSYTKFLNWYKLWDVDASKISSEDSEKLVDLILSFPAEEFFSDRVFEIWCLQQTIESFRRCGANVIDGPRFLFLRSTRSICSMDYQGYRFEIWFQKSLPSTVAKWKYIDNRKSLGGIPDITVIGDDGRRLLIDAKRREVRTATRPEETYKMLGYLENFRDIFTVTPFWGALCFLSDNDLFREVATENGSRVVLIGAHTSDPGVCAFGGRMDTLAADWLSHAQFTPLSEMASRAD